MEYNNSTIPQSSSASVPGHSMGRALVEHRVALLVVCVASLLAGIPLAINMFWHLQVKFALEHLSGINANTVDIIL